MAPDSFLSDTLSGLSDVTKCHAIVKTLSREQQDPSYNSPLQAPLPTHVKAFVPEEAEVNLRFVLFPEMQRLCPQEWGLRGTGNILRGSRCTLKLPLFRKVPKDPRVSQSHHQPSGPQRGQQAGRENRPAEDSKGVHAHALSSLLEGTMAQGSRYN